MRQLVLFMHVSLDGFVAGPNGEMDWIKVDDEIFDYAGRRYNKSDTALYGRVTYQMMEGYWPRLPTNPMPPNMILSTAPGITRLTKWYCQKLWRDNSYPILLSSAMILNLG